MTNDEAGPELCQVAITLEDSPSRLWQACPNCGHTMLLHPGAINPALTECQVCVVAGHIRSFE